MMININPILSPELLYTLRARERGDEITIVDANFPGDSSEPPSIRADGSTASKMLRAILPIMPLDSFVPDPVLTVQVVGNTQAVPETVADFQHIINTCADQPIQLREFE